MKQPQNSISSPLSASDLNSDSADCQSVSLGHYSLLRVINGASLPVFLDVFADFVVGDDGEPCELSLFKRSLENA